MFSVDLMIILFHLKLENFFCIVVINQLKVTCYDLFFQIKMSYYWFNKQQLLQKANDRYQNCTEKEKAAKYSVKNKKHLKIMHIISIETCQNKKKKQKNNTEKIDIEN